MRPTSILAFELQPIPHPDETRDVIRGRLLEYLLRGCELLKRPGAHDREAISQRERFDLVVGDVHGGEADPRVQLVNLGANEVAKSCIEIRQRLVEEDDLGTGDKTT